MKIALLAGEISGDTYGALLAQKLFQLQPDTVLFGLGGRQMRSAGVEMLAEIPLGTMGFSGVLRKLPAFYTGYRKTVRALRRLRPDLIVFINNPGFNLRLARSLGKDFPCYYYIPPKIWAHDYERIEIIRQYTRGVIPVFPFELEMYEKEKIFCQWFGHPVMDIIDLQPDVEAFSRTCGVGKGKPVIGILPGSRAEEVVYLMPELLSIAHRLRKEGGGQVVFSAVDSRIRRIEERCMRKLGVACPIWEGSVYALIKSSSLVLSASGTANLEIALLRKPFLVFYKTSLINYLLARRLLKVRIFSPANLCLDEEIVPEYIQRIPGEAVRENIRQLLEQGPLYQREMAGFEKLKVVLESENVTEKVAGFLLSPNAPHRFPLPASS